MAKAQPNDYNADLRFDPAPKTATKKELLARAELLTKAIVSGGSPRRELTHTEKRKDS